MAKETNTLDDYAEARKNAIRARQIREEHAAKLQREESDHYADYDASIIKKVKEKDEKKDKENFFLGIFFLFRLSRAYNTRCFICGYGFSRTIISCC